MSLERNRETERKLGWTGWTGGRDARDTSLERVKKLRETKGGQGGWVDEMHVVRHYKEIEKLRES